MNNKRFKTGRDSVVLNGSEKSTIINNSRKVKNKKIGNNIALNSQKRKHHVNFDGQERINYLYNAAVQIYKATGSLSPSRHYIKSMLEIGRKTMTRLTPQMKKSICKKCFIPLIPGGTCKNSIKRGKNHKWLRIKCLSCNIGHSIIISKEKKIKD